MKALYERLGNALAAIAPRNERARTWLDKLRMRCHLNSKADLDVIANRASVEGIRFDLQVVMMMQGKEPNQQALFREVEEIVMELEKASGLQRWETDLWQGKSRQES